MGAKIGQLGIRFHKPTYERPTEGILADLKGLKRICMSCGARFYDLNKKPIICPSCKTEFTGEIKVKSRRGRLPGEIAGSQVDEDTAAEETEEETDEVERDDETVSLEEIDEDSEDGDDDAIELDDDIDIDDIDDEDIDEDIAEEDDEK